MTLRFAELGKLERVLIAEGSNIAASEELDQTIHGLSGGGVPEHFDEAIARLAAVARGTQNRRAAEIAIGALVLVRRELQADEQKALAVLRFAQQRVDSLDRAGTYWANVVLDADDEANARALFEAAIGDASYSKQELIDAARTFIQTHNEKNSLFGRLAADLDTLVSLLEDDASSEYVEIARAALTYFVETADAIPDDLGFVGLLDDAYIVQQAVDQIQPGRSNLTAYLEDRVRRWPFLKNLDFVVKGRPAPVSDYMLINSGLLLDMLEPDAKSTVVIVPEVGPLPYLLGFVSALSHVSDIAEAGGVVLQTGDRLIDRDASGEVVFHSYLRQEGRSFVSSEPKAATHAQVIHPARGRAAEVLRTFPIVELGNFRRTALGVRNRTHSAIKINVAEREAGPLEQLVGTNTPIILDSRAPAVLVVSPIGSTQTLSQALEFFDVAAADVIPTGHLRRVDDGFEVIHWSKHGLGGEPMLCIVGSVDEAYEAVVSSPFTHRTVSTVISAVRPDSADASQLARIADWGVGVLAFTSPEDLDVLEVFTNRGASLWHWDHEWFGMLFWPRDQISVANTVVVYERRLRQRLNARNEIETVQFNEITTLANSLITMGSGHYADDESQMDWMRRSWWILSRICRWLTPITSNVRADLQVAIEDLNSLLRQNRNRWSEEFATDGYTVVELFERVLISLCDHNPKYERLISLAMDYPDATVLVAERDRERVTEALAGADVRVTSRDVVEEGVELRIIPAWYGQSRMARLAFASTYERQTLLLYEPESKWYRQARQRRESAILKTKALVGRHSAISINRHGQLPLPPQLDDLEQLDDPDEVLRKTIYRIVDRSRSDTDDHVNANIVGFVGGTWAAFTATHRLVVVSHLIDTQGGGDEVTSTNVSKLGVGDTVLLLRGSDRDAIRERANLSVSEDSIRTADMWKRALRMYVRTDSNLEELRQNLSHAGCPKSVQTIQGWISNDYAIGPQQTASVISVVAGTTGSRELCDRQEECLTAIREVRNAHSEAGKWLAKQVVERAREWTDAGATPDDLVELEEQLVMATVDFIDAKLTEIPTKLINRLQSSTWHT